ncbi:MAG: hydrogenase/urease maturation nickel metallochaperone HypA [Spirochaetia bacterium]
MLNNAFLPRLTVLCLEETKLKLEVLPANRRCKECGELFHVLEHRNACPTWGSGKREILSGKEFMIKEILPCTALGFNSYSLAGSALVLNYYLQPVEFHLCV